MARRQRSSSRLTCTTLNGARIWWTFGASGLNANSGRIGGGLRWGSRDAKSRENYGGRSERHSDDKDSDCGQKRGTAFALHRVRRRDRGPQAGGGPQVRRGGFLR